MFNLFKNSSPMVRNLGNIIMFALVVTIAAQATTYFYDGDRRDFLAFSSAPKVLSSDTLEPAHNFVPGDAMVLEYNLIKKEVGCHADYQNVLVGPVDYQFPTRKSQFLGQRGTSSRVTARVLLQLPDHLPKGVYQVQLAVFPTCDGIPRDAFRMGNPTPTIAVE